MDIQTHLGNRILFLILSEKVEFSHTGKLQIPFCLRTKYNSTALLELEQ